jgi:hypothetical protein
VPSTDRLISRPDPAVLGVRVAVGDTALDKLAGELQSQLFSNRQTARRSRRLRRELRTHSRRDHRLNFVLLSGSVRPGRLDARSAWRHAAEDPDDHSVAVILGGAVIGTVSLDVVDGMG